VDEHFGGDAVMFDAFLAGCLTRFADDLARGHAALASQDLATLRHVSHGLKAVLSLIGEPELAQHARALEDACAAGQPAEAARHWPPLAQGLDALRRPGG
jgi:HPt (histidine-containing phosphotransfer) domain-containing protein